MQRYTKSNFERNSTFYTGDAEAAQQDGAEVLAAFAKQD